jgi:transcriptional regulator with XRE-family HTH domain
MSSKAIGDRLRTAMKAARVTGEMLSEQIDFSLSGIRKWTSGQTDPGFSHMARAADALDLSLDWLATGEGPMWRRERQASEAATLRSQGWDADLMRECIVMVNEVAEELDRQLDGLVEAKLVFELYDLELERKQQGQRVRTAEVVRLFKTAG